MHPRADAAPWVLAGQKEQGPSFSSYLCPGQGTFVQYTACTALCHPCPATSSYFGIRLLNELMRKLSIGKSRNMVDAHMSVCLRNRSSQASIPCTTESLDHAALWWDMFGAEVETWLSTECLVFLSVMFLWKYFFPTTMNKRNERSKTTQTTCHFFGADYMAIRRYTPHIGASEEENPNSSLSSMPLESWTRGVHGAVLGFH